jgi:hypothetical protein
MTVFETARLFVRKFTIDDAEFVLTLLNELARPLRTVPTISAMNSARSLMTIEHSPAGSE